MSSLRNVINITTKRNEEVPEAEVTNILACTIKNYLLKSPQMSLVKKRIAKSCRSRKTDGGVTAVLKEWEG